MKINGKSIQGIYVYNENTAFEVGDLILYKNHLYIYSKSEDTPSDGLNPSESKDYTPYLGDKLTSLEDWKAFLNGESEDKYITTSTLVAILNTCMNDMRLDGIIENAHDFPEGNTPNGWILDEYKLDTELSDNAIIDEILKSSSNYAIYRVSRKLQGLWMVNYVDNSKITSDNYFNEEDRSSVLMKQYTYYSSETDKVAGIQTRIQELIDYVDGTVYYRYAKYDPQLGDLTSVSNWHSTRISKEYEAQFDSILNEYQSKISALSKLEERLKKNFRFKALNIVPGKNSVVLSILGTSGSVNINEDGGNKTIEDLGPITILLKEKYKTGIYISHEVTIEPVIGDKSIKYLLGKEDSKDITINVTRTPDNDMKIETSSKNITIQSMYYKEFY